MKTNILYFIFIIVKVVDVFESLEYFQIVVELVQGISLFDLIEKNGHLEEEVARWIFLQVYIRSFSRVTYVLPFFLQVHIRSYVLSPGPHTFFLQVYICSVSRYTFFLSPGTHLFFLQVHISSFSKYTSVLSPGTHLFFLQLHNPFFLSDLSYETQSILYRGTHPFFLMEHMILLQIHSSSTWLLSILKIQIMYQCIQSS